MGWNLRKTKKFFPFRISLTKTGIGLSTGIKGARISRHSSGRGRTQITLPGTGIYYRKDRRWKKAKSKNEAIPPPPDKEG